MAAVIRRRTWRSSLHRALTSPPFYTTVPSQPLRTLGSLIDHAIEEELLHGNRLNNFHPTYPGQVLDGRFKTIAKLGYGGGSTVWLAERLKQKKRRKGSTQRYVSIKISTLDVNATKEANYSRMIANVKTSHEGIHFLRTPLDEFQLEGPTGTHTCLVYDPVRETLYRLQHRSATGRLAPPLFKFFMYCILEAVDYLHTKCGLIHTDIKDDNILVTIEKDAVLESFVKRQRDTPPSGHIVSAEEDRVTYSSQSDFGPLQGSQVLPKLGDFNLCFPGMKKGYGHLSPIQSHRYGAPEVLMGCPWSYGVDIWNLGCLMWNLLEDVSLFGRPAGNDGEYDAHVHLAQMVTLLGEPPHEIIERERSFRDQELQEPIYNAQGKAFRNLNKFWGGPFFDQKGQIMRTDLIGGKKLANTVTALEGDEKDSFLDLASSMLHWILEKRKTTTELLQHPFFEEMNKRRAEYA